MDEQMTTDACTLPTAARTMRVAEFDALLADAVRSDILDALAQRAIAMSA